MTLLNHRPDPMQSTSPASRQLLDGLGRLRRQVQAGRFRAALGLVVAGVLALLLLSGLSDFLAGWERPVRIALVALALVAASVAVLWAWLKSSSTPLAEAARRADDRLGDPRRGLGAALDLAGSVDDHESPLHRHLAGLAVARAVERLPQVPSGSLIELRERRAPWKSASIVLLVLVAAIALHPRAAGVVALRLLRPWAELAPYSPWHFQFEEAEGPRVIYGKDADLAVRIDGPPLPKPVELLLRPIEGREIERLPTFREGNRHSRRIEGVTRPLEYAFAVGRARSEWRPLEILYQPRLESASFETKPPAYSRLAASRFELGGGDLQALRGSEIRLVVESNRPLSRGQLEGRAPKGSEVLRRLAVEPAETGASSVIFDWRVEEDLVWTLDLTDIRGARMEEPVLFVQQLVPDEKPEIENVEPGPFVFATPESEVRMVWDVSDDFGLDRLDLARVAGRFRERAASVSEGPGEKQVRLERKVPLSSLGVRPGQSLEYLVEARDRNPNLLGVSVSPATKVNIISEDEYAEAIRMRTTLEEFAERYRALREVLDSVLEALESLGQAADPAAAEAARQHAAAAHREAIEWFGAFAKDFPAFATDAMLNELSGGLVDELEANLGELGASGASDPAKAAELAKRLAERLRPGAESLAKEGQSAEDLAAIGGVMEMATELEAIRREQREISDRLDRLARELALGMTDNRGEVPTLREREMRNRSRLGRVESEMEGRIAKLPESAAKLGEEAGEVLEKLRSLEVGGQMESSVTQAGEGKVPGAAEAAALALANLEQILGSGDNDFTRICNGGEPGFCSGEGIPEMTLAQMLAALRARSGMGTGGNEPGGGGGNSGGMNFGAMGGSGYSMQGIQLNIPLLGPPRVNLSRPPGGGGSASKDRSSGEGAVTGEASESESLPRGETVEPGGKGWSPEELPLKYRNAVTRFYSDETPSESSAPARP